MNVGLVIKEALTPVKELSETLKYWCQESGYKLIVESRTAELLSWSQVQTSNHSTIGESVKVLVVLGGDGTLLGVARENAQHGAIMLGVNFGNLGFLTEIAPADLMETLQLVLKNSADIAERRMLKCVCYRNEKNVFETQAFNDVIIQKGTLSRLLELDVFMDERDLMRIRGDGIIFATPTGSTAYSMAAGGSIAYPNLEVVLLTPICPHSLTNRPIVLPSQAKLRVQIPEYKGEVLLSADGQSTFKLQTGDRISIEESPFKARLVLSKKQDYFSILRSKLNWSIPNQVR